MNQLVDELVDKLPIDGHPGGPGFVAWCNQRAELIRDYMERAYNLGYERGKDHGEESMKSWMQGGYE